MKKQKAVFLDRDGVINNGNLYYTYKIEDFKFNPDIFESLILLQKHHYQLVIITNQGGISKGEYSKSDVDQLHSYMLQQFREQGIHITEIYYCPHHSSIEKCICRKPDSGMIEKALARFNIDASASYLIGDGVRDIEASEKAGLKPIKIDKNESILKYCQQIVKNKKVKHAYYVEICLP